MKPRAPAQLPQEIRALERRALSIEGWTLFWMGTVSAVMYLAMGGSQAMRTAWIEDMLSLVPPLALLIALRLRRRPPDSRYPYGYERASGIAFLCAAVALVGVGLFLVIESLHALLRVEHPSIGSVALFGHTIWHGWVMLAALVYSVIPPVILGHRKLRLARELHLKALHTDAEMNKADWMTGLAGAVGVLGIGLGWWWADATAALFIAASVLHDGARSLRHAVGDLMDRAPLTVTRAEHDRLVDDIRARVATLPWVAAVELRLREEGARLVGEMFVVAHDGHADAARLREAEETARAVHWRVYDVVASLLTADEVDDPGAAAPPARN